MRGSIVWLAFAAATALMVFAVVNGLRNAAPQRPAPAAVVAALPGGAAAPRKEPATSAAAALPAPEFDVVTVGPHGQAVIAGHAAPGDRVRVMADGKPIGETTADANGQWVLLPQAPIAPGDRVLTLEARGSNGGAVRQSQAKVALSVVAPAGAHERSTAAVLLPGEPGAPPQVLQQAHPVSSGATAPSAAAYAGGAGGQGAAASTWLVHRGNSLWEIARRLYGEGDRYPAIYDANRTRIHDPDLIYPGQQFAVPGR